MKNKILVTQQEPANWLFKADHHYLAARLLFLHGLVFAAEENSSFAIELILKASCVQRGIAFRRNHELTDLWNVATPPFDLDDVGREYFEKLQTIAYMKHPDKWDASRVANDAYDMIDLLYLKLRAWVVELIPENHKLPTELDLAVVGKKTFTNYQDRHGSWSLSTILKRSNSNYDLL